MIKTVEIIKTKYLAGYLLMNGFTLLRTDKDKKNPKYDLYIFKLEDGIEGCIREYSRKRKEGLI